MGIIKAAINAVGGGLADSWLEVIEPSPMGDNTLICPGQLVSQNGKSQNKKGSENIVSNGSVIHVYDNQMNTMFYIPLFVIDFLHASCYETKLYRDR